MKTKAEVLKVMVYSDLILEVIDNWELFTQSDLQGRIEAIVAQIISETRKEII